MSRLTKKLKCKVELRLTEQRVRRSYTELALMLSQFWPVGSTVRVRFRRNQKTPTEGTVLNYRVRDVGCVRVRLHTKRGKAVNVHWSDIDA